MPWGEIIAVAWWAAVLAVLLAVHEFEWLPRPGAINRFCIRRLEDALLVAQRRLELAKLAGDEAHEARMTENVQDIVKRLSDRRSVERALR